MRKDRPAYRMLLVGLLSLNFGIVFFDRNALNFLMPFVQPDLNLSNTEIGLLASALSFTWAISGYYLGAASDRSGKSVTTLQMEASLAAIRDAGLDPKDIDGMVSFTLDSTDDIEVARSVGLGNLRFFSRVPHGGGAATKTDGASGGAESSK